MRKSALLTLGSVLLLTGITLPWVLFAQNEEEPAKPQLDEVSVQATQLEAELNKYNDSTPEAAAVMLKLADLYHKNARVFGLIRVGQRFIAAHPNHPEHKAMMLKLLDGLEATSRNRDAVILCRQLMTRYPEAGEIPQIEIRLAKTLEQMPEREATAAAWREVWKRNSSPQNRQAALRAMELFYALNNLESATQAGDLAADLLQKHPVGQYTQFVGMRAFQEYRRFSQWVKSNQIGSLMLEKGLPQDKNMLAQLHYEMSENYANQGQYANAVESLKKSLQIKDEQSVQYRLIERMHSARIPANELEPTVQDYVRKYPNRDDRFYALSALAWSCMNVEPYQKQKGVEIIRSVLPHQAIHFGVLGMFVQEHSETPEKVQQAEQVLLDAIQKNPTQAYAIRHTLAFSIYRDRIKNEDRTRQVLRELALQFPSNDHHTWQAIEWLLYHPRSEDEFKQDVARLLEARRKFIDYTSYRDYLNQWVRSARNNKEHKDHAEYVKAELDKANQNDPLFELWPKSEHGSSHNAAEVREQILANAGQYKLDQRLIDLLNQRQGYYYQHYSRGEDRPKAATYYGRYVAQHPEDFEYIVRYLQVATDYAPPEVAQEAATIMLRTNPPSYHGDIARRLFIAADKNMNADLARQSLAWIQKAQQKFAPDPYAASYIGDILVKLGLEQEGVAYWKQFLDFDRQNSESRSCAERLLGRMKEPQEKIPFVQDLLKIETPFLGRYAEWLAQQYLELADLNNFDQTLRSAMQRQAERPFQGWDLEPYYIEQWYGNYRTKFEKPEELIKFLTVLRDLEAGWASGPPALHLLTLTHTEQTTPMQKLLDYQDVTRRVSDDSASWDRLFNFAQQQMAANDYSVVATVLTGMLSNVPNVDENRKKNARDLVAQSYSRMGSVGLTIDENSPIAPLLQAALYLRLGDENLAWDAYQSNKALFAEHRNQAPVDLILFVCENLIADGSEENFLFVEDTLRSWQIAHNESKSVSDQTKADIQLLLAKTFVKAQRFDVARSEFTTLMNLYPNTKQAVEAEFGIGETFMAQKVYDQAEAVFEKLATRNDTEIVVRAEFLRGVLAYRRGDRDEARDIFRAVLERVPSIELANQALYNLAEVYGDEERYIEQLNLLRTVGRLGRNSKRTHKPGTPLSIVVQDADLGISRGHNKIPVIVVTEPGGDKEIIYLISGGAGKGLFRADLETALGQVQQGDNVLQITGNDVIRCDYPEEFKQEFRHVPISDVDIQIAADGEFEIASSKILDKKEQSFSEQLRQETEQNQDQRVSQARPNNQIKPGNQIYLRVNDPDRDLTGEPDEVVIRLTADSGDQVQLKLKETGPHTGIFEGIAITGELPAGALASDTSIQHSPLMAIDQDPKSYWLSAPDGATPKFIVVDMKDLKAVDQVRIQTPRTDLQAPVRGKLLGSNDGRFWFRLASNPSPLTADPINAEYGEMKQRVYVANGNHRQFKTWEEILQLTRNGEPLSEEAVETLSWAREETAENAEEAATVIWYGKFVQERTGAVRFAVNGAHTALAFDGRVELEPGPGNRTVDLWVEKGVHHLTIFASTPQGKQPVSALLARANTQSEQVQLVPFRAVDFDLTQPAAQSAPEQTAEVAQGIVLGLDNVQLSPGTSQMKVHEQNGDKRIGYWQDKEATASWKFPIVTPGLYEVFVECSHEGPGGIFQFELAGQTLKGQVPNTGNWNTFARVKAGTVKIENTGEFSLVIKAEGEIVGGGLMDLKSVRLEPARGSSVVVQENIWEFHFPEIELRYVKLQIDEYLGEAVAINQIDVLAKEVQHIPTKADVLAMANNNVLEIAGGDVVTASYTDEFTELEYGRSRLLTARLTATYYNAEITPIGYDFVRQNNGAVNEVRKQVIRIDPGERFVVEIVDYDQDQTNQPDQIPIKVFVNDEEALELTATETGEYTGIFTKEVDTSDKDEPGKLKVKPGDRIYCQYLDQQNTFPGHSVPRETAVLVRQPALGSIRIYETRVIPPPKGSENPPQVVIAPPAKGQPLSGVAFEVPLTVEVIDPDAAKDDRSSVLVKVVTTDGAEAWVRCIISTSHGEQASQTPDPNWALKEGRFLGQVIMQLGGKSSQQLVPVTSEMPRNLIGGPTNPAEEEIKSVIDQALVTRVLNLTGKDLVHAMYEDKLNPANVPLNRIGKGRLITNGVLSVTDQEYQNEIEQLHVGERLFLMVADADHDVSDERDLVEVEITTEFGEKETVSLQETTGHSGVFTGSISLKAEGNPTAGNLDPAEPILETYFGDMLHVRYLDKSAGTAEGTLELLADIPVVIGTDGLVSAFSKLFTDENLAVETQFHIAESYFELFKSHRKLGRNAEEKTDLEAGRRVLREVMEDYPDPKYVPRIAYLLGQFAQELGNFEEAIESYQLIVRQHPDHTLAPDAQFKLAQCYEDSGSFDQALEEYVTLAATYPKSPLIANVMIRISDHFYQAENFLVAAQVGEKFLERFQEHRYASRMAFRVGQCYYKAEQYSKAGTAFDQFVKTFPDDELTSQALFWAGESYRMGNDNRLAFQRYNRCRWDFPATEAAQYARGRLTLPEMLSQFQNEVNSLEDNDNN